MAAKECRSTKDALVSKLSEDMPVSGMWECPHPEPRVFVEKQCCACIAMRLKSAVHILLHTLRLALPCVPCSSN